MDETSDSDLLTNSGPQPRVDPLYRSRTEFLLLSFFWFGVFFVFYNSLLTLSSNLFYWSRAYCDILNDFKIISSILNYELSRNSLDNIDKGRSTTSIFLFKCLQFIYHLYLKLTIGLLTDYLVLINEQTLQTFIRHYTLQWFDTTLRHSWFHL